MKTATTTSFDWSLWPETQQQTDAWVTAALEGNGFAARLAARMRDETNTRFADWIDHLVLSDRPGLSGRLSTLGYVQQPLPYADGSPAYVHKGGMFPRLVVVPGGRGPEVREVALKVESVAAFSRAHDLGLEPQGAPLGPYVVGRLGRADGGTGLAVVERRGYTGFEPDEASQPREGGQGNGTAGVLAARDIWAGRRRRFDDDAEGFDATEALLGRAIDRAGSRDLACHLVFEAERDYWQSRNRAARVQKARQDRLGLGWANHDHHTFRCSRRFFPRVIRLFEMLGFGLRERYHAGAHAGWGAQILEHPTTGVVIFADLDLAPDEAAIDFAHTPLPDLPRPNTVGLWVGLHGESMLDAGMHHLEAQFDFDGLREGLHYEAGIETMKPFSDFPFLRQAFTEGERWPVSPRRADRLLSLGWIDADQHARFLREGAIGSHLENLQRRDGYKGFNQNSVSAILRAVDPRRH